MVVLSCVQAAGGICKYLRIVQSFEIVDWMLQEFSWTEDIRNAGRVFTRV